MFLIIHFLYLGQNMDHVYYTSKTIGPGDAGAADAWVDTELANKDEWKTSGFLSGTHCRAEV